MKVLSAPFLAIPLTLAVSVHALPSPSTSKIGDDGVHTLLVMPRGDLTASDGALAQHLDFLENKYAVALSSNVKTSQLAASETSSSEVGTKAQHCRAITGTTATASLDSTENGSSWATQASFGSAGASPAPFGIILDTASSDCRVEQQVYDPSKSQTAVDTGYGFNFPYSNGRSTSGKVYRDTLHIAGTDITSVGVGVSTTAFLSNAGGVCGMAPSGSSAFNRHFVPFFYQMVEQGVVREPTYAFALTPSGGEVSLGGVNSARFRGSVATAPALNPEGGFWKVDGTVAGVSSQFILDSSSKLMVVPPADVGTYFDKLGAKAFIKDGATYGSYNCASPPTLTFNFGEGATITVPGSKLSIGKTADGSCILPIVGKNLGLALPTVGGPLFENAYVVFNTRDATVGFAQRT